mgnify:CR=1 FL=1
MSFSQDHDLQMLEDVADSAANGAESGPSGTLLRGLRIIEALAEAPTPLSLAELAERVRLDNSTVHRLVQLLSEHGYAVRRGSSKRYCAGPMTVSLLSTYHPINNFRRETDEILRRVREETGETILLVLFLGSQRIILNLVQGRESLATSYQTWLRSPVHGSASGKVMLMYLPDKAANDLLGAEPYASVTPFTITDAKTLSEYLNAARKRGFVVARDDTLVGMTAIAAPILWKSRAIGCLTVAGDSNRLADGTAEAVGAALSKASGLMSNVVPSLRSVAHFVGQDF